MILIIGTNHDDVLYYESILSSPKEEVILDKYHALVGTIASQETMVLQDVYTSYLSGILATYIINHYFISLIINVGRCEAISDSLKVGDIVLSESIVFGDVDQIASLKGTTLGQIPGYPRSFAVPNNLTRNLYTSLEKIVDKRFVLATFVSSSFFRQSKERVGEISKDEYINSLNQNIVLDGESAGIALVSQLTHVPFIAVKVVEAKAGNYTSLEDYLLVLDEYAPLGKAVSNFIGEISRTDILRIGGKF
ncbi:MAG: hypothetical protein K6E11_01960 [Bacilli bacterium]|nr:hypothetical protein [Bacilli bacterium]